MPESEHGSKPDAKRRRLDTGTPSADTGSTVTPPVEMALTAPDLLTVPQVATLGPHVGNQAMGEVLAVTTGAGPAGTAVARTAKRNRYHHGQHGAKEREQTRLGKAFDTVVTGASHESEHAIGYEPLSQTGGLDRGETPEARSLENLAPAYQEVHERHRGHIGTGTTNQVDASGFNSHTYRDTQRQLVEAGDVSSAVQVNQLGYAFDPDFHGDDLGSRVADDSYDVMVDNLHQLLYADGETNRQLDVDGLQQAEMYLARRAARTGTWPTEDEIAAAKAKFGVGG